MKNKLLPAVLCGFGAAVFTTIPGIKNIACCLVLPLAAVISLYLYRRVTHEQSKIPTGTGLLLGFLTGVAAAIFGSVFDILITFITKSNDLITGLPQSKSLIQNWNLGPLVEESIKMLEDMADEIQTSGFSILYSILITISNLLVYSIFGFLGGALGLAIFNKRKS
ncbi:MAG TPA: hypothetical protein VH917_07205 [Ignavibacteriaceae bacterium]|jgi:hypothetical protein